MKLLNRRNRLQRLLDTLNPRSGGHGVPRALPHRKTLKNAVPEKDKAVKAGLVAGGLAGLTAGSAGISSLRRRQGRARDHS
jgi:hypothetical protein